MECKRLANVKKLAELYDGVFTQNSIRWWIFNSRTNGFDACLRRVGRRILIDISSFEKWIDAQNGGRND